MKTEKAIIKAWTADDKVYPVVVEFEVTDSDYHYDNGDKYNLAFKVIKEVTITNIVKLDRDYTALEDDIKAGLEKYLGVENIKLIY